MRKAVFLDRDGTLNRDLGYVHKLSDWQWLPGVLDALANLKNAGWLLLVASNQSGIGRGFYSLDDVHRLEMELNSQLLGTGASIDGWYYCPHVNADACDCRKPKPGLLLRAAAEWNVALERSWTVGDRLRDILAGLAAGCKTGILYNRMHEDEWTTACRDFPNVRKWHDLPEAADHIIAQG